ncbi:MAG: VWA domain-containing protein [Desulfurococcales archaeon]|nr:VWA domain-containing protein [Desulfurococcales archaeon]
MEEKKARNFLREEPRRLDPARSITLRQLTNLYGLLLGRELTHSDFELLYRSVGLNKLTAEESGFKVNVWESIKNDVSKLPRGFGGSFTRNQLIAEAKSRNDPSVIEAYLRLKRLGFVYEGRDGKQHVLGYREAKVKAAHMPSSKESLEHLIASSKSGWGRDDLLLEARINSADKLVSLDKLRDNRLLDVFDASLRAGNRRRVKSISEELADRLHHLGSSDRGKLRRIARKYRRELERAGVDNRVIEAFEERRGRRGDIKGWRLYARRFLENGNPGYLDMLNSETDNTIVSMYVRKLLDGDLSGAMEILSNASRRLNAYEILLLLRMADKLGKRIPRFFRQKIVIRKAFGGEVGRRKRFVTFRKGRVDVRRSIYMSLRLNGSPLVFRFKPGIAKISLAIDVSGSVAPYSTDVLLMASSFTGNIAKVVIFSDKVLTVDARHVLKKFDQLLSAMEFGGYTDLASALKAASKGVSRVVVISDFRHNVGSIDKVFDIVEQRIARGVKFYFIGVGKTDKRVSRRLEESGARVLYFNGGDDLEALLRTVKRLLL